VSAATDLSTRPTAAPLAAAGSRARVTVATLVALGLVAGALAVIVARSPSAWRLLAAGRPLVPEAYYPVSGYVLVLATVLGQAVGWAGGSALLAYVAVRAGLPPTWTTVRAAMSAVYLGLVALPLLVYHALFGGWLLGLPREGLETWLATHHPDARWLLLGLHPVVDLSLVPLAIVFLVLLWGTGDRPRTAFGVQLLLALAVLSTSLAVALSLAIHSTLAHIRLA
jgi:hypothetical protein